jgi:5-methylthioadenosine/S-adenosylhomocysteine deaminase
MTDPLLGVTLLPTDGAPSSGPVDIRVHDGLIADISPAATPPVRRRLAMPALANAHDHARPLSPTSFGGSDKPLESWMLRLGAMPGIDPYLAALSAFGRAARGGAASVMAHYTRFQGGMTPLEEIREVARAAADVGIRVTLALFMRDRNPLVLGPSDAVLDKLSPDARAAVEATLLQPLPTASEQVARVEHIAAEVESPMFRVQFGPNGPQWCTDDLIGQIARASERTGRRIHMHLLETRYQREASDQLYPEGVVTRLAALGLMSPRLTLAHCVWARPEDLDGIAKAGALIATNPRSNLHLRSGIAPIGEALKRGCRVALGVDASAFDEDDDILREMRLGHFLHGGWGFETIVERGPWLSGIVANGRFANGSPGTGALKVGEPADLLVLDLDRLDRDAIMPVEPIDYLFARATSAHIDALYVAGRRIVEAGRVTSIDLDAGQSALRAQYRERMGSRAGFIAAFEQLGPAAAAYYRGGLGCC